MRLATKSWVLAVPIAESVAQQDAKTKPLVIPASQYFEGNDGPWSTFDVRVGTPEQYIRVLPSTAAPYSLVPVSELGCSRDVFATIPLDCAVSRGNLFKLNESSSREDFGVYGINQNGVGLEANLGYEARVQFGLDLLGIGLNGPRLENQTVGGIAAPSPFYLGILGLNNQPLNLTTVGNSSSPALLTALKDARKIPSLSYSYTAGAKYRLKQVYGQIIFSGYDTSRFKENSVSFTMADDITRDLVVALQSISYSGSNSATLLSKSIDIMIDSTDPNIWLPEEACDEFEKAFGLQLDEESGLYLVNETHRNRLLDSNAEVSFRLSDVKLGGDTVTIVLPYAAFDLEAKNPLVSETSHYFPLKRANSSTQYTLGRVFLQEAYLSVDYERKQFNVSSCVWNQGAQENIVAITSKDDPDGNGIDSDDAIPTGGSGLSTGAIAGIVVGAVVGVALIVAAVTLCILRKRRKWISAGFASAPKKPELDEGVLKGPVFNSPLFNSSSRFGSTSTPGNSAPYSAADISGAGSTPSNGGHHSRSSSGAVPIAAVPIGADEASALAGASTVELDGQDTLVRPDTELDGKEVAKPLPSVAEDSDGVFELPGTAAGADSGSRGVGFGGRKPANKVNSSPSSVDSQPSTDRERESHSPPSPMTSTVGPNWRPGRVSMVESELVSPSSPVHRHSGRPF
ncbi:aspartic peptidase domain-containing protein [Podospora australis]|uniref:Aspartic peptidase domain-containing protein n=1 Tax=Podospora australis TaxID=1536484 RepID=A0AAN6WTW7_9PEZI|nr:aspartic peptidase domain-containing protein [Podospora australis]